MKDKRALVETNKCLTLLIIFDMMNFFSTNLSSSSAAEDKTIFKYTLFSKRLNSVETYKDNLCISGC